MCFIFISIKAFSSPDQLHEPWSVRRELMTDVSDEASAAVCELSTPVPFPTLYSGQECGRPRGAIEMLLYNIASMLASFGAGYDVRLSNVTPVHPNLLPDRPEEEDRRLWYDPSPSPRHLHNTYHGHTPHHRTPLPLSNMDIKPLRFTDSPQHGPLARRRSPTTETDISLQPPPPVATGPGLDRPLNVPAPDYGEAPGSGSYMMQRTAKFYQDQRECQRVYPGRRDSGQTGYSNPGYESHQPRTPGRVTFGHRRTPSGSSSYQYEDRSGPSSSEYSERGPPLVPRRLSRQGSYTNTELERPQTLELTGRTPLRSSLKKYNYSYSGPPLRSDTSGWAGWGSGGGTPTNENSSSEDVPICSYPLSKNDSGFVSTGRLNNPRGDIYTDWSPTGGDQRGSPTRRIHHPYAVFITENDSKKELDYFNKQ